jgi:hypothetical protein
VTVPLGIDDRSTIWLCLVDRAGRVAWRGSGGLDPAAAAALDTALATAPEPAAAAAQAAWPEAEQFVMAFDPRFRLPLAALGVSPATAHVTIAADRLVACFGPWVCRTAPANLQEVRLTGPYRWHRAIGPRLSLADHGLTFGSTTARGVCLLFREPVPGIGPLGLIRHPNLTLTAADRKGSPPPCAATQAFPAHKEPSVAGISCLAAPTGPGPAGRIRQMGEAGSGGGVTLKTPASALAVAWVSGVSEISRVRRWSPSADGHPVAVVHGQGVQGASQRGFLRPGRSAASKR